MKKVFHTLITRFNIEYLVKVPISLDILPSLWLKQRIDLFFEYCYPSIVNQSNKNFIWLVYFDVNTPKDILDLIKSRDNENIINIKLANSWINIDQMILKDLSSEIPSDIDFFVSSRLDNDDAIRYDFVESAHSFINGLRISKKTILDFQYGYVYNIANNQFFKKKIESNPFILLVEPVASKYSTVFAFQHKEMIYHFDSINPMNKRMWIHVVHDSNLINKSGGRSVLIKKSEINRNFGFKPKIYLITWFFLQF